MFVIQAEKSTPLIATSGADFNLTTAKTIGMKGARLLAVYA